MGDLIGGIIGGVGSLIGGGVERKADKAGAQQALTGYNYLTNPNTGIASYIKDGQAANGQATAATGQAMDATGQSRAVTDQTAGLLNGNNPSAMSNYLKSTGYNFQLQQGQNAITGNAATRGLLGSGATAKALSKFGTGLAGQTFNNYLNQRGAVAGQYDNAAAGYNNAASGYGATANRGLTAAGQIGAAGTAGGAAAGQLTAAGGAAVGGADAAFGGSVQGSGGGNFLGGLASTIGSFF